MQIDVLCIGHAAYDLSVFVDQYPLENTKSETPDALETCGGPAANAAWLLSSWGVRCAFAGVVGDDLYGRRIRDEFEAVGTDVSLLEMRPEGSTPVSTITINRANGSRTIVNRKPRQAPLILAAGALEELNPSILLFDGHEPDAAQTALQAFPQATSILDAGSLRPGTEALAPQVDYLAASERFARQTTSIAHLAHDEEQRTCIQVLRNLFHTATIVTLGERGLIADDGGGFRHLPAFPANTVDTTAAGDIFHGAFAFALTREMPFWDSLQFASRAASLSVQMPGGRGSIPPLNRVEEAFAHAR